MTATANPQTIPQITGTQDDAKKRTWLSLSRVTDKLTPAYFVYSMAAAFLLGAWIAPMIMGPHTSHMGHTHAGHAHSVHAHTQIEVSAANAPSVAIDVVRDTMSGWNLLLTLDNFALTPGSVNEAHVAGEGHAHIYVNGQKHARLYADAYHFSSLPAGEVEITVTLNANDHSEFVVDGERIQASATVVNPIPAM
ncbi:MAG: hypothetical protein AAF590_04830 [Pseudomonadota bacterium]